MKLPNFWIEQGRTEEDFANHLRGFYKYKVDLFEQYGQSELKWYSFPRHDSVYFIQPINGGPVKIGWSTDPIGRLEEIQPLQAYRLRFRAVFSFPKESRVCASEVERYFHLYFHEYRIGWEWFDEEVLNILSEELKATANEDYAKATG